MLGAVREDEAGCSAEHLRKVPLLEIFELPSGTLVWSGSVLLFSSLVIFNTLVPLIAVHKENKFEIYTMQNTNLKAIVVG